MQLVSKVQESIINDIKKRIDGKLPAKQSVMAVNFARQFISRVSPDDISDRQTNDLYGAILSHWQFLYRRKPGECKIRVFNPQYEADGWESTHTIVQIVHDDMPFLVDSIRMEINRLGYAIHFVVDMGGMKICRNNKQNICEVLNFNDDVDESAVQCILEAPIYLEIDRQTDPAILESLHDHLERVLTDVHMVVDDWMPMRQRVEEALADLDKFPPKLDKSEIEESKQFLSWLLSNHFTFLGSREYKVKGEGKECGLHLVKNSGLGVLHDTRPSRVYQNFSELSPEAREVALSPQILIITKTSTISTVHRSAYTDYISVKHFDKAGKVVGERRFIGLYTSAAYNTNPKRIPLLRHRVAKVLEMSKLPPGGHGAKALLNILETFPRDDLFQTTTDELFTLAMGILYLQERRRIKLFARKDPFGRFVSCLVYVPRDSFNTELRQAFQKILMEEFNGLESIFSTYFSSSVLARIHFVIKVPRDQQLEFNEKEIEKKLIEAGRGWRDELCELLREHYGEEEGNRLASTYAHAFLAGYRDDFEPLAAIYDIRHLENLQQGSELEMSFYQPLDTSSGAMRFKLFNCTEGTLPLSDVIPIFENMGLRVISEKPYTILLSDNKKIWVNDFGLVFSNGDALQVSEARDNFQDAFFNIWRKRANNDGFNALVLKADLTWHEVTILRAYSHYLRQIGFKFSQSYIQQTLTAHANIVAKIIKLFRCYFDPKIIKQDKKEVTSIEKDIAQDLEAVISLDDDRILRRFTDVVKATLRTNFFQRTVDKKYKSYIAFKLLPEHIPDMPKPHPKYEIYVYSPRFEGVHLRSGNVARGGLRWSDRQEDFRTEILGLMKAQRVKNAVIVPAGAKGGFVLHHLPTEGGRDAVMAEVLVCYKDFIRGLLDLTDNLTKNKRVKHPDNTICYDEDDPYLVVAADKGTATFSDEANAIAAEYDFWLGDAFASGGSVGYDHKKMGITARGTWESVKRNFREIGINIQTANFTVIGIGDMSGDVFGNAMLLSKRIKLVGVFNHDHIFLDPHPDMLASYKERRRLFAMPRSTWDDYDTDLISKGGGIYSRKAKSIKLSAEVKRLLRVKNNQMAPNELIHCMLKAKVDLLFNGGIGTYIKASTENHSDVGDKANDAVRVDAIELRSRVIGEGGNLGVTQLGRVEFAKPGGILYTDFIDNSAGVDCSDHEVNIKILLNDVVANGDMTVKQRNKLLADMTDEVAKLVLHNNYRQTQALSLAAILAPRNIDLHQQFIESLEHIGMLDAQLEFMPDKEEILKRKADNKGLTRPELSVLMAYCKNYVQDELLASKLLDDPCFYDKLASAFPVILNKKFAKQLNKHSLRREIIATQLSNDLINKMGVNIIQRLHDETGASTADIVRAYTISQRVFGMNELWATIESLDNKVSAHTQAQMMLYITRLVRRGTRWFLRFKRRDTDVSKAIAYFSDAVHALQSNILKFVSGHTREFYAKRLRELEAMQVPEAIAQKVSAMSLLFPALEIIEGAKRHRVAVNDVTALFFILSDRLELSWFRQKLSEHHSQRRWESLAITAFRDDFDWLQKELSMAILTYKRKTSDLNACVNNWLADHKSLIKRWQHMMAQLKGTDQVDIVMLTVALRELLDLVQTSRQMQQKKFSIINNF